MRSADESVGFGESLGTADACWLIAAVIPLGGVGRVYVDAGGTVLFRGGAAGGGIDAGRFGGVAASGGSDAGRAAEIPTLLGSACGASAATGR
jgi:hypothetical protein